jgi:hypothetical protein
VILYTFWQWILLFLVLTLGWKVWQNYQWLKLSAQVSPFFNRLIQDNKGCLTVMDLSSKANLSVSSAKRFLEKKAEEYGAQKRVLNDKGTVYYFLTVSALGAIFDDSESIDDDEPIAEPESIATKPVAVSEVAKIETIAEIKENTSENQEIRSLIQSELAKRLDSHPATIGRRKTDPDFADWTRSKDPEGVAWKYIPETSVFVAID